MARKLRHRWFASPSRARRQSFTSQSFGRKAMQQGRRRPLFEMLEARHMLSASPALSVDLGLDADHNHGHTEAGAHVMWASREEYEAHLADSPAEFALRDPWPDFDPGEDGFQLTYSYSNLLDGTLPGGLTPEELIAATEEALGLWASVAPLHFTEIVDSGPDPTDPSDGGYPAADHPHLRIGHHFIDGGSSVLAHAYFPNTFGLAGDVHFDSGDTWRVEPGNPGFDVIEVMTHELGHSLGLGHETTLDAIMNPFYGSRFGGPDTGFLLEDDMNGIIALYGEGEGSVTPLQPLLVDTLVDENDGDMGEGDVSLREALAASIEGGGKQKIGFAEEIFGGTIMLDPALGSLIIDGNVTIEGPGSKLMTVEATDPTPGEANGDGFRIFTISNTPDPESEDPDTVAIVSIGGLTLTGGDSATAGGAIFNTERLELIDVAITGNATMETGGGIHSTGLVRLRQSTVADNSAGNDGGGIHSTGGVHVNESTISGNSSGDEGGGISAEGIEDNAGREILVTSSTISGNTAVGSGGGMHVFDENPTKLRVIHSTVVENASGGSGGGIYQYDGVLVLDHTIVANNTDSGSAPDLDNVNFLADPAILARFSLIGNSTGSIINQLAPNQIGTPAEPIDPLLNPLADNGGRTLTHQPMPTSPALDAGNFNIPFPPEFDQRGAPFARIIGGFIDIGAVETTGFAETFIVDTLVDESDSNLSAGDLSLREAIERSNATGGTDRILFAPALAGGRIMLNSALGEILISDSMTIDAGALTVGITIDASNTNLSAIGGDGSRLFRIDNGNAATLLDVGFVNLTLTGGDVTGDGGAIHSLENLTLEFVSIDGSAATGRGGGVYHQDGKLNISNSAIVNNSAATDGGGLYSNTKLPLPPNPDPDPNPIVGKISNTTFSGNVAGDEGGGVFNFDGQLTLEHVTVTANTAVWGGGVVSFGDTATETHVSHTIIAGNTGLDVSRSRNLAFNSFISAGYNLVGVGNAFVRFNKTGDLTEVLNPMLGSLGNHGGSTPTHVPLAGSPVIDAGDPALADVDPEAGPALYDQRGAPFSRFGDGNGDTTETIDIGAYEIQTPQPNADFDGDDHVDGFDFLAWQRGVGKTSPTLADGDSNGDGAVDGIDLSEWEKAFGSFGPAEVVLPQFVDPTVVSSDVVVNRVHVDVAARNEFFSLGAFGRFNSFDGPAETRLVTDGPAESSANNELQNGVETPIRLRGLLAANRLNARAEQRSASRVNNAEAFDKAFDEQLVLSASEEHREDLRRQR